MKPNSNPPFAIGQRVVCVKADGLYDGIATATFLPKKGGVYVVKRIERHCCFWCIDIGSVTDITDGYVQCYHCNSFYYENTYIRWFSASRFAPCDPPKLEIPAELLEEQKTDCIDVEIVKEVEV